MLHLRELRAAGDREVEQRVKQSPVERVTLSGPLHLNELCQSPVHTTFMSVSATTSSS